MYRGKVTAVDASGVYVQTAEYGTLGPCQAVVANYYVDSMVLCVNVGDEASPELVVVGELSVGDTRVGWDAAPGLKVSESGGGWVTLHAAGNNIEMKAGVGTTFVIPYNSTGTSPFKMNKRLQITATAVGTGGIEMGASGPTITVGAGAPSHTPPNGSVYLRTDGTASTTLYVRAAGTWTALS
jgi:hypothetical protein